MNSRLTSVKDYFLRLLNRPKFRAVLYPLHIDDPEEVRIVRMWKRCPTCNTDIFRPGETLRITTIYKCSCGYEFPISDLQSIAAPIKLRTYSI